MLHLDHETRLQLAHEHQAVLRQEARRGVAERRDEQTWVGLLGARRRHALREHARAWRSHVHLPAAHAR